MNSKIITIVVGLVLVVCIGSLVYFTKKPFVVAPIIEPVATTTNQDVTVTPVQPTTPPPAPTSITLAQVTIHNSESSCWSAINGSVYDLTSWIPNHPGGEKRILSLCGIDGSDKYNGQHGGSAKIARVLGGFKIGTFGN